MSEGVSTQDLDQAGMPAEASSAHSAGALLRQAREAAGLSIEALALQIKVAQRKLEALESDRYDALPDAVFVRALAQTVCRALRIDPAPVLSLLPEARRASSLENVTHGLNQPFQERGSAAARLFHGDWERLLRPGVFAPLILVAGAAAIYFWPQRPLGEAAVPNEAPAASAASSDQPERSEVPGMPPQWASDALLSPADAASVPATVQPASAALAASGAASALAPVAASAASAVSATDAAAVLILTAREDSWIEVRDAQGRSLLSRLLRAGESMGAGVETDARWQQPLSLKIGNAQGTQIRFRGQVVEVPASAVRDNVARMELK